MEIIDAELNELKSAIRRGRSRSPEVLQLIEAIQSLEPGQAKAIVVEPDETAAQIRVRLMYAAIAADIKLQIANEGDRVMFALNWRGRPRREG